jgi:ribonuclease HI
MTSGGVQPSDAGEERAGEVLDLQVYCDGCYEPLSDTGGWAFVVYRAGVEIASGHGGVEQTSNNAMELAALLQAALWLNANSSVGPSILWTDSAYAVNGCHRWRHIWRNRNWRKKGTDPRARSRPVPDAELWKAIDAELSKQSRITIAWCKGHAGLPGNERADRLAEAGRIRASM